MEKKAKVTKLTKFDKVDNYGNTSFAIEFENGDKGYYSTKYPEKIPFIVGNVADYLLETLTKKDGSGTYNKIKVPGEAQTQGGFAGKPKVDPKTQIIGFSMSYTKDLIVAGKVPMTDLEKEFNRIYNLMASKL